MKNLRKYSKLAFWAIAVMAWWAFQEPATLSESKPKVKKEVRKDFAVQNAARVLEKQTETEFDIYGKIVQYSEFDVLPEGRTILNRQTVNKYNAAGRRIGTVVYDADNTLLWSEEIELDDDNRTTKITQTDYLKSPINRIYTLIEYDEYGNEAVSRTFSNINEQTSEKRRTYNDAGELLVFQQWLYVQNAEKKWVKRSVRTENEFNSRGHIIKSISDYQEGKRKWREVKHFENCAIVECDKYENGKLVSRYRRQERDTSANSPAYDVVPMPRTEYDDYSERDVFAGVEHTEYRTVTLKTDKNGNVSKKVVREYNQVYSVTYYFYDDANNLIKERTILKSDDSSEERQYTYDEYNNLVRETILKNDQPVEEHAIVYEYYPN